MAGVYPFLKKRFQVIEHQEHPLANQVFQQQVEAVFTTGW